MSSLGTNGLIKSLRISQNSSVLFDFCRQLRGHIGSKIYWISFCSGIFAQNNVYNNECPDGLIIGFCRNLVALNMEADQVQKCYIWILFDL